MSDPLYDNLFHRAVDMQYKFHDFTAGANHPEVHVLQNEIHQLIGDIREHKDTKSLEYRINTIQHQLSQSQHVAQPFMQYGHSDYLHSNYEQMRHNILDFEKKQSF